MKVTTEFATGGGKGIEEVGEGHWRLEMRRDQQVYENYFHFRVESEDYEGEATLDVYPDQDFLPVSRRILDTHFSPATLWRSPEGPFTQRVDAWRPHPQHLTEWHRDFIRMRVWLEPESTLYVSSHHPLAPENWTGMMRGRAEAQPDLCRYGSMGETPDGHALGYLRIGNGSKRVMIVAAEHPIETPGSWATWGVVDYLTSTLREARELVDEYTVECFPVVNVDGLARGNACFNSAGTDLFRSYTGVREGRFEAEETRLIWQHAVGSELALLLNFHCYMGGDHFQDYPGEGHYMILPEEQEKVFSPETARLYREINDSVVFAADARSSHYLPAELGEESLCYEIAAERDVPSVFYEFNGALNGPYRNMKNGIGVFSAAMRVLREG